MTKIVSRLEELVLVPYSSAASLFVLHPWLTDHISKSVFDLLDPQSCSFSDHIRHVGNANWSYRVQIDVHGEMLQTTQSVDITEPKFAHQMLIVVDAMIRVEAEANLI